MYILGTTLTVHLVVKRSEARDLYANFQIASNLSLTKDQWSALQGIIKQTHPD